jgi:two-component sensor histidine kinase
MPHWLGAYSGLPPQVQTGKVNDCSPIGPREPGNPGTLRAEGWGGGMSGQAGSSRLPATRLGVERALVWAFVGIRAFDLLQAAVALCAGSLRKSTDPALDIGLVTAVAAESVLLGRWLVRRGSMLPFGWPIAVDYGLAICVIASVPAYIPVGSRLDTWTMWAYPLTLSTAVLLAAGLARPGRVLAASGTVAIAYLAVVALPLAGEVTARATSVVNALAYPGFAMVAFLVARFVRGLAGAADAAKERVAELERERSRAVVHDLLTYLRLDRFVEADDQARAVMIAQAHAKHEQMRSYVDGTGHTRDLGERVNAVLRLHPGLPVRRVADVEPGVQLPEDTLEQLGQALDTALANVEQHAPGASVTLSVRSETDHVAVTVRDDGPGFDQASHPPGFGVREILGRQLEEVGGRGEVHSVPGGGTQVRIMVPKEHQA